MKRTVQHRWRVGTRKRETKSWSVGTRKTYSIKRTVQHRWRGAHGIPTLARGNEKLERIL
jgi:hypothetical protein